MLVNVMVFKLEKQLNIFVFLTESSFMFTRFILIKKNVYKVWIKKWF